MWCKKVFWNALWVDSSTYSQVEAMSAARVRAARLASICRTPRPAALPTSSNRSRGKSGTGPWPRRFQCRCRRRTPGDDEAVNLQFMQAAFMRQHLRFPCGWLLWRAAPRARRPGKNTLPGPASPHVFLVHHDPGMFRGRSSTRIDDAFCQQYGHGIEHAGTAQADRLQIADGLHPDAAVFHSHPLNRTVSRTHATGNMSTFKSRSPEDDAESIRPSWMSEISVLVPMSMTSEMPSPCQRSSVASSAVTWSPQQSRRRLAPG